MANTQFEAIYHCGDKEKADIRINVGEHTGTYPYFKSGVPTIVDEDIANELAKRDDFTINPVMEIPEKAPEKRTVKKT